MNVHSCFATVPFDGELSAIDGFYKIFGVDAKQGVVSFGKFEFFFGGAELGFEQFQVVITVDEDPCVIEDEIKEKGGNILERGFDGSGPYLDVEDPAGLKLRVYMEMDALAEALRNHQDDGDSSY